MNWMGEILAFIYHREGNWFIIIVIIISNVYSFICVHMESTWLSNGINHLCLFSCHFVEFVYFRNELAHLTMFRQICSKIVVCVSAAAAWHVRFVGIALNRQISAIARCNSNGKFYLNSVFFQNICEFFLKKKKCIILNRSNSRFAIDSFLHTVVSNFSIRIGSRLVCDIGKNVTIKFFFYWISILFSLELKRTLSLVCILRKWLNQH